MHPLLRLTGLFYSGPHSILSEHCRDVGELLLSPFLNKVLLKSASK